MTAATEIVTSFMEALEAKEFDRAATYLADEFVMSGLTPKPLTKKAFLGVMSGFAEGIPNFSYNMHDVQEIQERQGEGNRVKAVIKITGTQTDGFILVPLGLPPVPQTARSISTPEEHWEFSVRDDKITMINTERLPGGGVEGMLNQLGISMEIVQ